jgi:hypothetical protein
MKFFKEPYIDIIIYNYLKIIKIKKKVYYLSKFKEKNVPLNSIYTVLFVSVIFNLQLNW